MIDMEANQIINKNTNLFLIVGNNKTNSSVLNKLKESMPSAILINIGYVLSQKLLHNQTEITRDPQTFFDSILDDVKIVLFDNIDILFDRNLDFDPLSIFKKIATQKKLISVWPGIYEHGQLIYAKPGHLEYRKYIIDNNEISIIKSDEVSL